MRGLPLIHGLRPMRWLGGKILLCLVLSAALEACTGWPALAQDPPVAYTNAAPPPPPAPSRPHTRTFDTVGVFDSSMGRAALIRARDNGIYDVKLLDAAYSKFQLIPVPLTGNVTMVGQATLADERVVVFQGSAPSCPVKYVVLSIVNGNYTYSPIGHCGTVFQFGRDQTGRRLVAMDKSTSPPRYYIYQNRKVTGPFVLVKPPAASSGAPSGTEPSGAPVRSRLVPVPETAPVNPAPQPATAPGTEPPPEPPLGAPTKVARPEPPPTGTMPTATLPPNVSPVASAGGRPLTLRDTPTSYASPTRPLLRHVTDDDIPPPVTTIRNEAKPLPVLDLEDEPTRPD